MKYILDEVLTSYTEKNINQKYQPVAVGKYGIRKREDIYKKKLCKDISKNKIIRQNTLTIGMGSTQIDIGILSKNEIYCVSPAYHTYKINIEIVLPKYLEWLLKNINNELSKLYMIASSRQGKKVDFDRLMKHTINISSLKEQEIIVKNLEDIVQINMYYNKIRRFFEEIVKSQFIEMFGDCKKDTSIGEVTSEIKRGQWGEEPLSDGHNYKVIKTNNMEYDVTLELENVVVRNIKKEKFEKNKLEWGDILVEKCGGTKTHSVGYSCLFLEYDDFVANNFIMILTPNKQKINPYFLQYQLRYMYEVQDFADCFNKTTGIQNLKVDIYKNKKICIPNIELQNKFASFVQLIDKSKYFGGVSYAIC